MPKVILLTGGSSGIGRCTARALKESGCTVYELSRHNIENEGVTHIGADVTDEKQVNEAVGQVIEREGRIDVLINNAGFGISGAVEFTENADAKRLLDVNLFGAVNTSRAVLSHMRENAAGRIINLSSVAGEIAIPFQAWYSISKAAVLSLTMALASETVPFGIEVCAILPGDISSGFTAAREKSREGDDVYGGRIGRSVAVMERDERTGISPETAGAYIARIAMKKRVKPIYVMGFKYKFFVSLSKLLPASVVKNVIGKMYAE